MFSLTVPKQDLEGLQERKRRDKPGRGNSGRCLSPRDRRWSTRGQGGRLLAERAAGNSDDIIRRIDQQHGRRFGTGRGQAREKSEGRPVGKKESPGCLSPVSIS